MTRPPNSLSFLPVDEPLLLSTRPGFIFVLVYRQGWWLVPPLVLWLVHWGLAVAFDPAPLPQLPFIALLWLVLGFLWRIIAWLCRHYVLTERRALVVAGVVARVAGDVPLRNVQHTTVTQSIIERLFGLGTIGIATAGSGGAAINWLMVPHPQETLDRIRHAVDAARRSIAISTPPSPDSPGPPAVSVGRIPASPPVIGLAGGIGSGKSEAARILQSFGAVVIDSDREAKEALDRPEIRTQLVQWWGPGILAGSGRVSRHAVADIIFNDPEQRRRLESIVHPIVRMRRDAARRLAREQGARAVVIDAPLLFEAGVDGECDRIIFIDAPADQRLARVRASRNWSQIELARREASQMPLEEKRHRSDFVVVNDGPTERLAAAVQAVFEQIVRGR